MTISRPSSPLTDIHDSPPPYTMASDGYVCMQMDAENNSAYDEKEPRGSTTTTTTSTRAIRPNKGWTLPRSSTPRRRTPLRTLLTILAFVATVTYYRLWSTPAASDYQDEVNFHSWSASLSHKHYHHNHHHHHHHSQSWWKSLTGKRPPCSRRVKLDRIVHGLQQGLRATAAHAQTLVPHSANHLSNSTKNTTKSMLTVPNVAKYFEDQFLGVPSSKSARAALKSYTDRLHLAGTFADYNSALQIQREWAELLGAPEVDDPVDLLFDAGSPESIEYLTGDWTACGPQPRVWTDTYYVWLNFPKNSSLSLAEPNGRTTFTADLHEDIIDEDPTSSQGNVPFHGYSKPGAASGPIVYAGLCSIEDFTALKEKGVRIEGAITLCRYGGPFRGLKVRASADAGAVGTLIYSDPLEDGNVTEANGYKVYPDGPARQPHSVQRGSVQALSFYPGDPGTPGEPSYRNASRLDPEEADSLPKIPSLPISYTNAKPLLEALVGHGINTEDLETEKFKWVGKVPGVEEYWSGPSELVASMENNMTAIEPKPIWNTYAYIPGLVSDEVVITAVHRDAWTFGGADPSSGTSAMHELVAGLGHLVKDRHWRPLRSILIASWDAEEYGLVGSTEFGEDYGQWLRENAVAYFNTDVAAAGSSLKIAASPSLSQLYRDIGKKIEDPEAEGHAKLNITTVGPLGSGSDFSVFLEHLGVPSSDVGYAYSAQNGDAVYHYHSNYDSFYYMEHFGDPGFKRITTIAKVLGLATVRMSQSLFLHIDVGEYVDVIGEYIAKAQKKFEEVRKSGTLGQGRRLTGKWQGCPHSLFKQLWQSHTLLQAAVRDLYHEKAKVEDKLKFLTGNKDGTTADEQVQFDMGRLAELESLPSNPLPTLLARVAKINYSLRTFEQTFIHPDGLKDRPWYKSLLVGPGRWRGYGATPLPGLTEAITLDQDWDEIVAEAQRLDDAMARASKVLRKGISKKEAGGAVGVPRL